MTGERPEPPDLFYGMLPRLASFGLALGVTALVLVRPVLFTGADGEVRYLPLLALMWGLAAGYTHGVGFVPRNPVIKILLGPGPAWVLLVGGLLWALLAPGPGT